MNKRYFDLANEALEQKKIILQKSAEFSSFKGHSQENTVRGIHNCKL